MPTIIVFYFYFLFASNIFSQNGVFFRIFIFKISLKLLLHAFFPHFQKPPTRLFIVGNPVSRHGKEKPTPVPTINTSEYMVKLSPIPYYFLLLSLSPSRKEFETFCSRANPNMDFGAFLGSFCGSSAENVCLLTFESSN